MNEQDQKGNPDQFNGTDHASKPGHHEVTIVINGTPMKVQKARYTYEQIYTLAFPGQPLPKGTELPITYKLPHGHQEGSLLPGDDIEILEGMVFNVQPTIKS